MDSNPQALNAKLNEHGLSRREERFCLEYVQDLCPGDAYQRVGYKPKDTASAQHGAYRLLEKPRVRQRVNDLIQSRADKLGVSAAMVVEELIKLATFNPEDFFTWDSDGNVTFIDSKDIPRDQKACITGIKTKTRTIGSGERAIVERETSLTFVNKVQAVSLLLKHLGIDKKDIDAVNDDDLGKGMAAAEERMQALKVVKPDKSA